MPEPGAQNPVPGVLVEAPGSQLVGGGVVQEICAGVPWLHTTWHYVLIFTPNQPIEHIRIFGDVVVDELVIDTLYPEPATVGLLALGGVASLVRRKRS